MNEESKIQSEHQQGGGSSPTSSQDASFGTRSLLDTSMTSFAIYYFTSLIVVCGVVFGTHFVTLCTEHSDSTEIVTETLAGTFAPWDGVWYRRIAAEGYSYNPDRQSSVAMFPLYPLVARALSVTTGLHIEYSLLLVSHLFLFGAFLLIVLYLRNRSPVVTHKEETLTLLVLGLFPTTFFMRMTYTESTFLFLALLSFYAMVRRWPVLVIALIVGLSTATRPTGVALIPVFLWHLWEGRSSYVQFLLRSTALIPIACWGLLAYMAYQWYAFDEPLAFVKIQVHWSDRMLPETLWGKLWAYTTLAPFRDVYDSTCPCHWARHPPRNMPIFSMEFMNPIYMMFTWLVVGYGAFRRWLSPSELLLSAGLFLIPYLLHAYPACMASEARYASVVFPAYIVLGKLLSQCTTEVVVGLSALSAAFLAMYSALFVSWYWFI